MSEKASSDIEIDNESDTDVPLTVTTIDAVVPVAEESSLVETVAETDSAELPDPLTEVHQAAASSSSDAAGTQSLAAAIAATDHNPLALAKIRGLESGSSTPLQSASDSPRITPHPSLPARPNVASDGTATFGKMSQYRQRVEEDSTDGEAWLALVADAESKGDLEKTREIYEQFLKIFPDSGPHWVAYADLELRHSLFQRVEAIFGRCLRSSTSAELWQFYVTYIRRMNKVEGVDAEKAKQSRTVIGKAYEFSLLFAGHDRNAGVLWADYIGFLRSLPTNGMWEEQQNMDTIRKTYQKAVTIPLANVEQIWSEYNHWEQNLNKLTAKKFIGERSGAYMSARGALRELKNLTESIFPARLPRRPDWSDPSDRQLVVDWRAYLKWEESNPLSVDDPSVLQSRILYCYRKAFGVLRFYPEIWYSASAYARSINKADDAVKFLEQGRNANPTSLLVTFAYAEAHESKRNLDECYKVYDALLAVYADLIEKALAQRDANISKAVEEAESVDNQPNRNVKMENADGDDAEGPTLASEIAQIRQTITNQAQPAIDALKRANANIFITEMRFARRAEGIKQARAVFGKARKFPHVTWQVLYANAMMEYHWNKEPKIATNVFELGLKTFADDVEYVSKYLDFLIQTNDETNARAVFERTISKLTADQARPLWEKWASYECQYSDLAAIQKLDQRIGEAYPGVPAIFRFAERHVSLGMTELLTNDLGLLRSGKPARGRSYSRSTSPLMKNGKRQQSEDGDRRSRSPQHGKRQRRDSPEGLERRVASPALPKKYSPPPHPLAPKQQNAPMMPPAPRYGEIPEAVAYFLSRLPMPALFRGPVLPTQAVTDLLLNVNLPPPRMPGGMNRPPMPMMANGRFRG